MRFGYRTGERRRWFAWYPVKTWEGEWLWLETVYKGKHLFGMRYEGTS